MGVGVWGVNERTKERKGQRHFLQRLAATHRLSGHLDPRGAPCWPERDGGDSGGGVETKAMRRTHRRRKS